MFYFICSVESNKNLFSQNSNVPNSFWFLPPTVTRRPRPRARRSGSSPRPSPTVRVPRLRRSANCNPVQPAARRRQAWAHWNRLASHCPPATASAATPAAAVVLILFVHEGRLTSTTTGGRRTGAAMTRGSGTAMGTSLPRTRPAGTRGTGGSLSFSSRGLRLRQILGFRSAKLGEFVVHHWYFFSFLGD